LQETKYKELALQQLTANHNRFASPYVYCAKFQNFYRANPTNKFLIAKEKRAPVKS